LLKHQQDKIPEQLQIQPDPTIDKRRSDSNLGEKAAAERNVLKEVEAERKRISCKMSFDKGAGDSAVNVPVRDIRTTVTLALSVNIFRQRVLEFSDGKLC
jgi:hypothetical protein